MCEGGVGLVVYLGYWLGHHCTGVVWCFWTAGVWVVRWLFEKVRFILIRVLMKVRFILIRVVRFMLIRACSIIFHLLFEKMISGGRVCGVDR